MSDYRYSYEELTIELNIGGTKFERVVPNFTLVSKRNSPVKLLFLKLEMLSPQHREGYILVVLKKI